MALDIDEVEAGAREARELTDKIRDMLAGRILPVQATVVGNVVGIFLAGWPQQDRPAVLSTVFGQSLEFATLLETIVHGPEGHPSNDGRG